MNAEILKSSLTLLLLTALTMLAFAANSVLNRMALAGHLIGPSEFALIRLCAGAGILALLVRATSPRFFDFSEVSVTSVGALAVYMLGFSFAYIWLDVGTGALILFGGVQVTMFAGALAKGERPSFRRWAGATLAFAGLAYLMAPSASAPDPAGAALMAAAAVGWGIYSLIGRSVRAPLQATAANFLLAVPVAVVVAVFTRAPEELSLPGVALAILSGAVTSGLGYALWYWVLPRIEASLAAVAQLTVPVIALAGGYLFLTELPDKAALIAGALVLAGVALAAIRRRT